MATNIATNRKTIQTTFTSLIALLNRHPYLLLFAAGLIIRLLVTVWVQQPGVVDAYYYYQAAENWRNGQGFVENTVWNYQVSTYNPTQPPPAGNLTHPAFDYWNPLASWLAAGGMFVLGTNWFAAALPFMLCAALLAPLGYYLGRLMFGEWQNRYSWAMGLIMLFPGRYFLYWGVTDNFSSFALVSLLCLITLHHGLYRDDRWLIATGVLAGLAYLSRSDGVFFVLTLLICFLWVRWRPLVGLISWKPRWVMLGAGLGAALVTVLPWLIRNYAEFGAIIPASSGKAIWLREYTELFSFSLPLTPQHYFDWGIGNILSSKLGALSLNASLLIFQGPFLLGPFFLGGLFVLVRGMRLNRYAAALPFLVHIAVLYFIVSLVFTELGNHGTIFHAAGGFLPFQAGTAVATCDVIARAYGRRRKLENFKPFSAALVCLLMFLTIGLTLYFSAQRSSDWNSDFNYAITLNEWFTSNNVTKDVIIVGEPLSFYHATKRPAIGQASDGVVANLEAARRYGATYLVLGIEHYKALDQLYKDKVAEPAAGLRLRLVAEFRGNQIYKLEPLS